jgi:hypothetical protein
MVIEIGAGNVRVRKEDQILRRSSVGRVRKRGNCAGVLGWGLRMGILEGGEREMKVAWRM